MARTLNDEVAQLAHQRRERIEMHASELIAEELRLRVNSLDAVIKRQVSPKLRRKRRK
jgi:hypothetical protein